MHCLKEKWLNLLGNSAYEMQETPLKFIKKYEYEDFDLEIYTQRNGMKTFQRVMIAFPKNLKTPCPVVITPYYFPEGMLGFDPETGAPFEEYGEIFMMKDLVKRGYMTICADAYHLTYTENEHGKIGFDLWQEAGEKLLADNPQWTGMGKLVSDTKLLIDIACADP